MPWCGGHSPKTKGGRAYEETLVELSLTLHFRHLLHYYALPIVKHEVNLI